MKGNNIIIHKVKTILSLKKSLEHGHTADEHQIRTRNRGNVRLGLHYPDIRFLEIGSMTSQPTFAGYLSNSRTGRLMASASK